MFLFGKSCCFFFHTKIKCPLRHERAAFHPPSHLQMEKGESQSDSFCQTPTPRRIEHSTVCQGCREKGVKRMCKHRRGELAYQKKTTIALSRVVVVDTFAETGEAEGKKIGSVNVYLCCFFLKQQKKSTFDG